MARGTELSHGGVILIRFNALVVRFCLLLLTCLIVAGATLVMKLNSDCRGTTRYHVSMFGYEGTFVFHKDPHTCV